MKWSPKEKKFVIINYFLILAHGQTNLFNEYVHTQINGVSIQKLSNYGKNENVSQNKIT